MIADQSCDLFRGRTEKGFFPMVRSLLNPSLFCLCQAGVGAPTELLPGHGVADEHGHEEREVVEAA
jgi:hypothetical protein